MRVLFVISDLNSGGAQKLIADIAILLNDYACRCDVFVLKYDNESLYTKMLVSSGVNIIRSRANKYWALSHLFDIKKHKKNYDFIHSHMFQAQYLVAIDNALSRKHKKKIVTTEHSTHNRRRKKQYLPIEKFIYKQYQYVIAISKGVETSLINWIGPKLKTEVIPNGIMLPQYDSSNLTNNERCKLSKKDTVKICMVGRLTASKNQQMLIDLISVLPNKYVLTLVGGGEKLELLKSYANDKNVEARVFFMGQCDDVTAYLKKTDLYIHASNWEGFGLAVVEAMSLGLPVLASNIDGLKDIVKDVGIVFENGNVEELKNIVLELEHDEERLIELKSNSIKAVKNYDINCTASKYFHLYKKMERSDE